MSLLNEAGFQKRKKAARSGRLAERGFYSRPVRRSSLELPPAAQDGVAQCAQPQIDREQYRRPDQIRRIGDAEKGVAKAGNGVEERVQVADRSEEHTSELQSLMRISYAVFCLKKKSKK